MIRIKVFFILIILVLFSGCSELNTSNEQLNYNNVNYENSLSETRESYGIPENVFEELPVAPQDFEKIVSLLHENKFLNYRFFSEKYFLQPEFYPSFPENALNYWLSSSQTHYAAAGYGFYPVKQNIVVEKKSSNTIRFFVHAGYGVQSYQGIKINYALPENSGIGIEIIEPEFLLSPSYPKFTKNWAKEVDVKITTQENVSSGIYEIKFTVSSPSNENREKWNDEIQGKYFDAAYAGAPFAHSLIIEVK